MAFASIRRRSRPRCRGPPPQGRTFTLTTRGGHRQPVPFSWERHMPEPMSDIALGHLAHAANIGDKIATERLVREVQRLRTQLAAAEAVCRYARHLVACERQCPCEECMSKRAKQSHRSGCICGFTEAQKVRQALRGGGDDPALFRMLSGLTCSLCGIFFVKGHGYSVLCAQCYADSTQHGAKSSVPKATKRKLDDAKT